MVRCRIGIVGAGGVGIRHARTLAGFPEVELVGVADVDAERRTRFAAEFGARPFPDLADLLDSTPDAVYVCVPPFAHGAVEEAVVATGAALFVEKPLALNFPVAERIAGVVAASGVVTAVGHHWRYSTAVHRARELLAGRTVRLALGMWLDKVPPVPWWSHRAGSGGQIVEQAVHVLDLARVLVGEVREVHAFGDGAPPEGPGADIDGATVAILRFGCGAVGTVAASCRLGWKHRAGLEVCADGIALAVTEDGLEARDEHGTTEHRVDPAAAKAAADRAFVHAVLGRGEAVLVDYADALRTHQLACAVATAATEATRVVLPGG